MSPGRALLHSGENWYTCLLGTIKCTGSAEPGGESADAVGAPLPVWTTQDVSAGSADSGVQVHVIVVVGE